MSYLDDRSKVVSLFFTGRVWDDNSDMTQDEAFAILKTGASVFLTGEPGSGKTHMVNRYVSYLRECGIEPAITASTGIAATHIGGMTLHSWSGIGVKQKLTPYDLDAIASNKRIVGRVGNTRVLIIDEVSMLSARTLSMVEAVCREVRQNHEPFGGLQVVLVGDFFQLPPITARDISRDEPDELFATASRSEFAFMSPVWQKTNPLVCYLSEQHRQEDAAFLEFLTAVRKGAVEERHKALLRTRYARAPASNAVTHLYSHNADVDHLNATELAKLQGAPKAFVMEGFGPDALVSTLKRGCLSPETLSLKVGARVMFTKNDNTTFRFVNGTIGEVTGFSNETGMPTIRTRSGRSILAEPMEWTIQDGGVMLARVTQVPLRLAWAITVHKSQGMSLDSAHMNLSDAFEYGQGYVAISRVRTLSGLSLAGLNRRALEVHPEISAKDRHFRASSDAAREKFRTLKPTELSLMHDNFIRAIGGKKGSGAPARLRRGAKKEKRDTLAVTNDLALQGLSIQEIADERGMTVGTILNHLEQLALKGTLVPARDLAYLARDPDRFAEMEEAFKKSYRKTKELKLSPVRAMLDDSYSFEELRLARLFLGRQEK